MPAEPTMTPPPHAPPLPARANLFRIALVTFSAPSESNPTSGVYNLRLAQALNNAGCVAELFVCSPRVPRMLERVRPALKRLRDRPTEWTFEGVRCHGVPGMYAHPNWVRWKLAPKWPRLAEAMTRRAFSAGLATRLDIFGATAILAHDGVLLGDLVSRTAARRHIPFAIIEHDTVNWTLTTTMGRRYAAMGAQAKSVFGVGLPSVRALREELGLANARLCPNGIARATEQQLATPRPAKYAGKRVVLCVGSPVPGKGHVELVRAFGEAAIPESVLVLVSRAVQPDVQEAVNRLGLGSRFEHLMPMAQQDVQQLMVWADVFAMPSHKESFGMVYGEAIAAGTPVILTDACGIAPHIVPGVHGWVVPVGDHAALVGALRQSLSRGVKMPIPAADRRGIEEAFTWENSARAVLEGLRGETTADATNARNVKHAPTVAHHPRGADDVAGVNR